MSNFKKYGLTGVSGTIELGKGGAKLYNNSGALEAKNNAEDALAILRSASPVGNNDVVTKQYLETYGLPKIYGYIYDNTGADSDEFTSSAQEGLLALAVDTVGSFTVKKIYRLVTWDTDVSTSTWTEINPTESMTIATRVASPDATIDILGDHLYLYDTDTTSWVDMGPYSPVAITYINKNIRATVQFGTSSPVAVGNVPSGCIVTQIIVKVTTAFDGTDPTLSIGVSGTVEKFMSASEIDLKTVGTYIVDLYSLEDNIDVIATYVADSSTAGVCQILLKYDSN